MRGSSGLIATAATTSAIRTHTSIQCEAHLDLLRLRRLRVQSALTPAFNERPIWTYCDCGDYECNPHSHQHSMRGSSGLIATAATTSAIRTHTSIQCEAHLDWGAQANLSAPSLGAGWRKKRARLFEHRCRPQGGKRASSRTPAGQCPGEGSPQWGAARS